MTVRRAWILIVAVVAAVVGVYVPAAPTVTAVAECLQSESPPDPPPGGAVLWSRPDGSTARNTLVLHANDHYSDPIDCYHPMEEPWVISVAPGAALAFWGSKDGEADALLSPWGAVNVPAPGSGQIDTVPCCHPKGWDFTSSVSVMDTGELLAHTSSCRHCDLSNRNVVLPRIADDPNGRVVAFAGDVSGATWHGATVTGDGSFYDFSGSDLSGATFRATLHDATFGTVTANATSFTGSDLRGATFARVHFQNPPSFAGATLGCTTIANTNLVNAGLGQATWSIGGCNHPLFPGSHITPLTLRQVLVDANVKTANFAGATVVASAVDRRTLAGTDLRGVNLGGVAFLGEPVDLTGTRLDGATLSGANFGLADLTGATFTNVHAAGASFQGADLSAEGSHQGTNFSGSNTNLQGADFVDADVGGASFVGADLTSAVFTGARGLDADFAGVRARDAIFSDAHFYGNAQAFHGATDLANADFTGAVMAGDVDESGGFDFTGAPLTGARFDGAVCVACNFTNATLTQASFTGAYLPGVGLSGAHLSGVSFDRAWLYCGSLANDHCTKVPGSAERWAWPLVLGSGESFGPVPFAATNLTGVDLTVVRTCPDGKSGAIAPHGCPAGHLLPRPSQLPPLPAPCSASAHGGCPTATSTLLEHHSMDDPLAVVAAVPPTWNTELSGQDYYVAFDDAVVRRVSAEGSIPGFTPIVAGTPGDPCPHVLPHCGDGGAAFLSQLVRPTGLAVGLDGSLYIADVELRRVRKIDPVDPGGMIKPDEDVITNVAGTGAQCDGGTCGDGGPATSAALAQPFGIAVDPYGVLLIADGSAGVRRVAADGTISTLTPRGSGVYWSVATGPDGTIYAATRDPDHIVQINPTSGAVTSVVGTGTSGYNGNSDELGVLLPGTEVQINQPGGLSVDLAGNIVFADTANHLIRAYVPSSGHVIDDLAGSIVNDAPVGGFNGDGHWSNETQLHAPVGVTATRGPLLVIADTNNHRVRQVGPPPAESVEGPRPPQVVVSCQPGATWSCERIASPSDAGAAVNPGSVSVAFEGTEVAAGRWLAATDGDHRFFVTEARPLVPGSYQLIIRYAGRRFERTIQLTQEP